MVYIGVILLSTIISAILMTYFLHQFYGGFTPQELTTDADTIAAIDKSEAVYNTTSHYLDYSVIILLTSLTIGTVVSSYFIPTHPIFLAFNILGIFFLVIVSMVISNTYGEISAGSDSTELGSVADEYPIATYVMQYWPYLSVVIAGLATIVMFAKWKSS